MSLVASAEVEKRPLREMHQSGKAFAVGKVFLLDQKPVDLSTAGTDVIGVGAGVDEPIVVMVAVIVKKMHSHMSNVLRDDKRAPVGEVHVLHAFNETPLAAMLGEKVGLANEHSGGPGPLISERGGKTEAGLLLQEVGVAEAAAAVGDNPFSCYIANGNIYLIIRHNEKGGNVAEKGVKKDVKNSDAFIYITCSEIRAE